jgi:hypothetical protein
MSKQTYIREPYRAYREAKQRLTAKSTGLQKLDNDKTQELPKIEQDGQDFERAIDRINRVFLPIHAILTVAYFAVWIGTAAWIIQHTSGSPNPSGIKALVGIIAGFFFATIWTVGPVILVVWFIKRSVLRPLEARRKQYWQNWQKSASNISKTN